MSPAVVRLLRLGAVCLSATPVVLVAVPWGSYGWSSYGPLVRGPVTLIATEALAWADPLLPVALALLVLWAPTRTRLLGLPLTLLVIAADVVIPLRYPWIPPLPRQGGALAALAAAALLLAVARPAPGTAGRRAAAGWTAALLLALWPALRLRLGLADPGRCGDYVDAVLAGDGLTSFRLTAMIAFHSVVVVLVITAVAVAGLGPRGARVVALVTAAGLSLLALPVHGYPCLVDMARWPYLVAAACVLVAGLGTPVRRLRPWPGRRI
ncbi:hypothetical protein GCM10010149_58520 [Nonomuraea roseoviolacea subsp. roseoviolacea]|uniref:hypothetical protein n=1 Tax=Nonomuraea roseoviolacea TaxID=103837 RepID=UPI0031E18767